MTLDKFLSELEELEKKATPGPWSHEEERYSAKNVIGVKPADDRWVAHCQPEFNGHRNANFISTSRNSLPKLIQIIRVLHEECENHTRETTGYYSCRCTGDSFDMKEALKQVDKILEEEK